jgi:hypothetical protein
MVRGIRMDRATTEGGVDISEAASLGGLFLLQAASRRLKQLMFGENFSRAAKLILPAAWNRACPLTFSQTQPAIFPVSKKRIASGNEFGIRVPAIGCRVS